MARQMAFAAVLLVTLAGAQARVLQQALAPQLILAPPPPTKPYDPKVLPPKGATLGDLTGIKSLPPLGSFIFPNGTICQNSGIGNIGCSNNGNFNFGVGNTGSFNKGNVNLGDFNDANANNGNANKGDANAGSFNTGSENNGNLNSGNQNDGNGNSGNQNTGTDNSGDANNGIANSGDANNGNFNGGDENNGSGNNGTANNGDGNLGSYNTGSFNTASYQTGSYISPNGTVNLYPIQPEPSTTEAAAPSPTLSQVLASVFGGSATTSTLIPITSTTSLGDLVNGLTGSTGR